ncbi:MAG: DUF5011 domain-containing protein [Bacilli bacterium]|nr:DUF5011 domain-containing protein [Bacilli bacterium]
MMYLNHEKGNTNIDNQFKKNRKLKFKNIKKPLIIGIVSLVVIATIVLGIIFFINRTKYFITLQGEEYIKIYQGTTYQEPGYNGFDNKQNNLTDEVIVLNNINSSLVGTYTITYKLKRTVKTRTVEVVQKGVGTTYIHLYGDDPLYLPLGSSYQELGYKAIDSIDSDITNDVKVTSNLDSSKTGVYRVVYSVTNSSGITTSKTRTVIVK